MTEFQLMKEQIDIIKGSLSENIRNFSQFHESVRANKESQCLQEFSKLDQAMKDIRDTLVMWSPQEANEARVYLNHLKSEVDSLRQIFEQEKAKSDKAQLFSASVGVSGEYQRNALKDQKQTLQHGDTLIDELIYSGSNAVEGASSVAQDLSGQGQKMKRVSGQLDEIDSEVETGNSLLNKMICRNRQRTIFLWTIIIILLVLFVIFFILYFH